jgi:cell division protein ZapA
MDKQRVVVEIFREQYSLKSDLPEDRVQKLAEYVDKRMRRIADQQPNLPSSRLAVLVALQLAEEVISSKEAYDSLLAALKEELAE